jgi:hypothetical protein
MEKLKKISMKNSKNSKRKPKVRRKPKKNQIKIKEATTMMKNSRNLKQNFQEKIAN